MTPAAPPFATPPGTPPRTPPGAATTAPPGAPTAASAVARTVATTLVVTLIAALCAAGMAQEDQREAAPNAAAVRFAYLLPGGPNLDVRLQDRVLHPGLIAQTVSGYFMVESGEREFDVTPVAGTSVPGEPTAPDVSDEQIATRIEATLAPGTYTTILITGTLGEVAPPQEEGADGNVPALPPQVLFETSVVTDDLDGLPRAGEAWVRAVNAALDTPPLEVALQPLESRSGQEPDAETTLAADLAFGAAGSYVAVPGAGYRVVVRTRDRVTVELPGLGLDSGLLYTVYVTEGGSIVTVSVDGGVTLAVP